MKKHKRILYSFLTIAVVFFVSMLWYQYKYTMDNAVGYEVNNAKENTKLLIATQGSVFKNTVTDAIVEYYKTERIYIKVIDISALTDVNPANYNAILVVHTWEMWKPPSSIKSFIDRTVDDRGKIVVLTTSGEGTYKMEGVDAITGESNLDETPVYVSKIINKLNPLLGQNSSV